MADRRQKTDIDAFDGEGFEEFEDDFEMQSATYKVLISGRDELDRGVCEGIELLASEDPYEAVDYAKRLAYYGAVILREITGIPESAAYFVLEACEFVDIDGEEAYQGTICRELVFREK